MVGHKDNTFGVALHSCFDPDVETSQQLQAVIHSLASILVLQHFLRADLPEKAIVLFLVTRLLDNDVNLVEVVAEHCALVLHQQRDIEH